MPVSTTNFTWTIKDFDMCPQPPGQAIESPYFSADPADKTKFSLWLYPRGRVKSTTSDEMYVSLYLKRHCDEAGEEINLNYVMSLFDVSSSKRNCVPASDVFKKDDLKGHQDFIERNLLIGTHRLSYFSEDILTVFCAVSVGVKEETDSLHWHQDVYEHLSSDYGKLLENGNYSDMSIKMIGKEFKVHRAMLEARCPDLVQQLVRLKIPNTYSLRFADSSIFPNILKWLYTGELCDDGEVREIIFKGLNEFPELKASLFPSLRNISATTEIRVSHIIYPWLIAVFDELEVNEECCCRLLSDGAPDCCQVTVSLMKMDRRSGENNFALKFKLKSEKEIMFMRCKIQCSSGSHEVVAKEHEHLFEDDCEWIAYIDIKRNAGHPVFDGDMKLLVNIRLSVCVPNAFQSRSVTIDVYEDSWVDAQLKITFQRDLCHLFRDKKNTDLTLKVGSKKISVHKAILSCRSQVFSKMIDTKGKDTDILNIVGIDRTTMMSLLTFIYCGDLDVPLLVSSAVKLYTAAEKFEIKMLIRMCHVYLKDNINANTVCEILVLARTHDDLCLNDLCCEFIETKPDKILHVGRYIDTLENMRVCSDILNKLLKWHKTRGKHPGSPRYQRQIKK